MTSKGIFAIQKLLVYNFVICATLISDTRNFQYNISNHDTDKDLDTFEVSVFSYLASFS